MSPLTRWFKFNLVGALCMLLQLATLACLNRLLPGHYLASSAAAIELTLLHNFLWHVHYTWRDRTHDASPLRQLLRFHLSNGLVSLLGNLALMRLLVGTAHLPVLIANAIAILCCSLLNFSLSNLWTFPPRPLTCQTLYLVRLFSFSSTAFNASSLCPASASLPAAVSR